MDSADRKHDDWTASPEAALALLLLTDQFPRNIFRSAAHMYATDLLACLYARQATDIPHTGLAKPALRLLFCLPFARSEDIADQEISGSLKGQLGPPISENSDWWPEQEKQHRHVKAVRQTTVGYPRFRSKRISLRQRDFSPIVLRHKENDRLSRTWSKALRHPPPMSRQNWR
ncbi:DUF924 family protein [Agrobacterium tumefaciens]|uniref:DUF924 family protein n=1 Tax=Agrobacterium tumefaciens TaxID=358 RepID=A0A4D7YLW8_AGRTU|nr:DUF924 family protein [Agrobacterium tumefaciens]